MTTDEAKRILLLYRPQGPDAEDPEIREALVMARNDAALQSWLEQHLATQEVFRRKLRTISVPQDLERQILNARRIVPIHPERRWYVSPVGKLAAAAVLFLGLLSSFLWFRPSPERFANFQTRMVSTVLREYRMDIVTNADVAVRQFMNDHGAPSTYDVPPALTKLKLTGGGLLRWRNHPVSMICYDRGTNQMVFLFVLNKSAAKNPPSSRPRLQPVNKLMTASWTRGEWTYLMASEGTREFPAQYLPPPEP